MCIKCFTIKIIIGSLLISFLQVAGLSVQQREGRAALDEAEELKAELANARHSLEMSQSALRDGQLHQTQMVREQDCV